MKLMGGLAGIVCAAAVFTGCGSGGTGAGESAPAPSTTTSEAPTPTDSTNPNDAVCSDVQELLAGDVKETFGSWDTDANLFDKKVGKKLRKYATKLYSIQPRATGAVSDAIAAEAKALTDISIAIDLEDDSQIGSASNAANSSLAQVRGVCNF